MLNEILTWWTSQMLELIPRAIRRRADGPPDACILAVEEPAGVSPLAIRLGVRRAGRELALGRFVADAPGLEEAQSILGKLQRRLPIAVRVSDDVLLEREITLPFAAETDLANVLRYDMERLTPFTSEELFWTCAVTRRDRERRTLHVRLSLVPKVSLPSLHATLGRLDAAPSWLEVPLPGAVPRIIPLGHMAASQRRDRLRLRLAVAGIGGLMVAAVVLPFILQSVAQARIDAQMRTMEPRVQLAETLRQRIATYSSAATLVAGERGRVGDPLAVLAAVTTALPDDTFLADLTLRQGKLEIAGESKTAARLIAALAANPAIRNPAFMASVTRAENGTDAFSIRADIVR